PGPPGLNKVVLPAENSGKISASRHALTASRYHSSNPGLPPHELLTTSGAISTRPPGARIHSAPASKTSSVVLPDSLNTLTAIPWSLLHSALSIYLLLLLH